MIDLHTHSLLSDGLLLPSELARRAEEKGYVAMAITDHVDWSNFERVVSSLIRVAARLNKEMQIRIIPGCEITHVPPGDIPELAQLCRDLGAQIIVAHGETPVEPVKKGTNAKALEANIDILAHPGLLTDDDAKIAAQRKIAVEVTTRAGHSLGNGHIAKLWYQSGFPLVLNTDSHAPSDLVTIEFAEAVLLGAGIQPKDIEQIFETSRSIARRFVKLQE
jgi:histidinol phosphatase-like PHP family hydrolase